MEIKALQPILYETVKGALGWSRPRCISDHHSAHSLTTVPPEGPAHGPQCPQLHPSSWGRFSLDGK